MNDKITKERKYGRVTITGQIWQIENKNEPKHSVCVRACACVHYWALIYILLSVFGRLAFSWSFSWEISWYGFFLSSSTAFPISTSLACSSCRDRNSTMPAPMESPKTFVVVRSRSLQPRNKGRRKRLTRGRESYTVGGEVERVAGHSFIYKMKHYVPRDVWSC